MSHKHVQRGGHTISGLFIFLLIGIFAIASITLVLSGINVYRQVQEKGAQNIEKQLALSYLGNKVHAYDRAGSVSVETRDGMSMLCLREAIDGEEYITRIYYHEGAMCEQFVSADEEFDPELGERLTEVKAVQFKQLKPDLLQVEVTLSDGSEHTLHMALRSSQAG